jgi:superfamily II DNA/RNA helicase
MKGIEELGFTGLFPIQAQAMTPLLEGKDVIGQAQTGTGKTAAFGIPMIERLNPRINTVQGLVLEPTRELAIQVADHISRFGKFAAFNVLPVYGGDSIQKQINALKSGVHIVVGTPGRIIDHLERRTLNLASVRIVVLDEADRMLDMGFIDDIESIIFCRTRTDTSTLADKLRARGYDAEPLHAGFTQPQRDFITNSFRKGKLKLLVATDVAARGLDIQGITHIINYDIPLDALVYFHRIGRTARMGLEGTAITLVGYGELTEFNNIRALTKTTIEELE